MSTILVTGATGNVGHPIAARLAAAGHAVRALVRSPERARPVLPEGVEAVQGDVTDPDSVRAAVQGCELVYHAAGLPEQWRLDPADFTRVNVEGTRNMVSAAQAAGVDASCTRARSTSSAGRPASPSTSPCSTPTPGRPTTSAPSKRRTGSWPRPRRPASQQCSCTPRPCTGPAPVLTPGLNDFLVRLAQRKIPMLLPGGMPVVYSEDVADGHIRAATDAPDGARYILSGPYLTLEEIARAAARHVPSAKVPRVMPIGLARALSVAGEAIARVIRKPPLIARGQLHFLESHAVPVARRAEEELGWFTTSLDGAVAKSLMHFAAHGWTRRSRQMCRSCPGAFRQTTASPRPSRPD